MALPDAGRDIEFRHVTKSTGRITTKMIVDGKWVFWMNKPPPVPDSRGYMKCSMVSVMEYLVIGEWLPDVDIFRRTQ